MEKRIFNSVYTEKNKLEVSKTPTSKILLTVVSQDTTNNEKINSNIFFNRSTAIKLTKALKKIIATIEE